MEFEDLIHLFSTTTVELILESTSKMARNMMVRIQKSPDCQSGTIGTGADFENTAETVTFATEKYANLWERIGNGTYLAQIKTVQQGRAVVVAVHDFDMVQRDTPLSIAVTDQVAGAYKRADKKLDTERLLAEYTLDLGGKAHYILRRHYQAKDEEVFALASSKRMIPCKLVARQKLLLEQAGRGGDTVLATQGGVHPLRKEDSRFTLVEGAVAFTDGSKASRLRESDKAFLRSDMETYLKLWNHYNQVEQKIAQDFQQAGGTLQYEVVEVQQNQVVCTVENWKQIPVFMENLDAIGASHIVEVLMAGKPTPTAILSLTNEPGKVILKSEYHRIPMKGALVPCIAGTTMAFERREQAFRRIYNGQAAKGNLAQLISGRGVYTAPRTGKKLRLHPTVEREMFGAFGPTDAQRKAIEIALNTPDFAIIQGPPGTGKTKVLSAIVRTLSLQEKDPDFAYANNLLTAYQGDATDNLAQKLRVYGLPIPSYRGKKTKTEGGSTSRMDSQVRLWLDEMQKKLLEKNENLQVGLGYRRLQRFIHRSLLTFQQKNMTVLMTLSFLESLHTVVQEGDIQGAETLLQQLETLCREAKEKTGEMVLLGGEKVKLLPVSEAQMSDCGMELAEEILEWVTFSSQSESVTALAEELDRAYHTEPLDFTNLQALKVRLLIALKPIHQMLPVMALNAKVVEWLHRFQDYLDSWAWNDESLVLFNYYQAITDDQAVAEESLQRFLTAISATHQQSSHRDIVSQKKEKHPMEQLTYENVFIDEAARSCPPDLLIPMCCAKNRIVMVGDHKQLPQFISDKVYEKMDEMEQGQVRGTMFEHLVEQAQNLQAADGIPRFAMLDSQFRMPPHLGDLVSRNFYEGQLRSPETGQPTYEQRLPKLGGLEMAWCNVSGKGGKERRSGTGSYYRTSEVESILQLLRELLDSETGEQYTYGIITFYGAQKEALERAIGKSNLFLDENGERRGDLFKVGTVDSFQGLEFDIVILSMVRSNTTYTKPTNRFGFITNQNRQCVALSRAKRCMVVVGDGAMMQEEGAYKEIPALLDFYQCCVNEEVPYAQII